MKANVRMDGRLMAACNGIFDVVRNTGVTRLKHSVRLSSLLSANDEEDPRLRQRNEAILEDLRNVRGRGGGGGG